jgi:hypothetical protein
MEADKKSMEDPFDSSFGKAGCDYVPACCFCRMFAVKMCGLLMCTGNF